MTTPKNENTSVNADYFESYDDLDVHQLMLKDVPRIEAYKNAILSSSQYFKDKVVMDVGAGTGILSLFCAKAGAKKIYAVEASGLADIIPKVLEENNFTEVIEVMKQRVEDVNLPDRVDVIVSEWMGFYLLHEGMLDSVLRARDLHLKPEGKLFPEEAQIWCAPCSLPHLFDFWHNVGGFSMQSVGQEWRLHKSQQPQIVSVSDADLLTAPSIVSSLDLNKCTSKEIELISNRFIMPAIREGKYQGLCIWFTSTFPRIDSGSDVVVLSTAPRDPLTHWKQTVVMLPNEQVVEEEEPLAWELQLKVSDANCRHYEIQFTELDPDQVTHPIPCQCYMTKCIVMRAFLGEKE